MTWRLRFVRWLLRHEADWILVPTEHYIDYTRILIEEAKLRALINRTPELSPVMDLFRTSKREILH